MLRRYLGQTTCLGTWCARFVGVLAAAVFIAALGAFSSAQSKNEPADKAKLDRSGDPLPAGALARMGTLRWRHAEAVSFVAFTPDGKSVLTASQDGLIRLWERDTGKAIRRFEAKGQQPQPVVGGRPAMLWNQMGRGMTRVALSHDGKIVAAVLGNNAIQLWNVDTGKEIRQLTGPQTGVNSILFAPDGKSLAARGFDRATYLLDAETAKQLHVLKGAQPQAGMIRIGAGRPIGDATGFAFSADSKTIATAEMEFGMQKVTTYLKFTDTATGKEIRKIETSISSIVYSPDGKILAYGVGNDIKLCEPDTGKEIRTINSQGGIGGLAFSADSKTLAAKGRDQAVRLFETDTGKSLHTFGEAPVQAGGVNVAFFGFGGGMEIRDFAFSADSKVLAMGGSPALHFFTVADGKEQAQAGGHRASVTTVMVTPDGKTMISRGADSTIRRWDAATGAELGQFVEPKGTTGAVFSLDGKTAALANSDGTIRLHAVADGKKLHELKGHKNGTAALAFAPNGKLLASRGMSDNTIRVHDVATGGELKQITINPQAPVVANPGGFAINGMAGPSGQGLAFSSDSQTIAANVNVGNAIMLRPQGGVPPPAENKLHLWDVATGKELRKITLPAGRVITSLAYSPDGRLLASENTDQTISLWEVASGKERAVLGQPVAATGMPNQPVTIVGGNFGGGGFNQAPLASTTLAFSPDGSVLVARGQKNTIRAWEVSAAKEIGTLKGHDGAIQAVAFAPNGKALASASADTTLLVWDLARLNREPMAPAVALAPKQVEALWTDLLSPDAVKAGRTILTLASAPKSATPFLAEKLKPAPPVDVKKLDQAILDLDSSNFVKRSKATGEIEKFGELAIPALNKALASNPTVETRRRIEPILEKLLTGTLNAEEIRTVRTIEVLERLGTPEARQVLQALAQGAPGALPTREAQKVLGRQGK